MNTPKINFQKILQLKCQLSGHNEQPIDEYMKYGDKLMPMCSLCKNYSQFKGEYYNSKAINQQLELIFFEIKKIIEIKSELMKIMQQFRELVNLKVDLLQNSLNIDFFKIINHESVKKMKQYYQKEQLISDPTKHIQFATTFLRFENSKIDRSELTNILFSQKDKLSWYQQKMVQLSKIIKELLFEECIKPIIEQYIPPHPAVDTIKIQKEVKQVQICQQIEKDRHLSVSTFNKKHCLTITPYKSFCLSALWISMLADQAQKPLLNIRIYKNTIYNQIQEFTFRIDDQTPVTDDKYKVYLQNQCELLEGNKYSILIDHIKQYSCLFAEFYKCNYTKTNTFFEIVDGFIEQDEQDEKQIINQIQEGLIFGVELLI